MAGNKNRRSVHDEDFKNALNSKLQEMSKVADLKAMFNQDPTSIVKPPTAARKPTTTGTKPATATRPNPTRKPSFGQTNGTAKPVIPNGLQKELNSVRLKSHDKPQPGKPQPGKPQPGSRADRSSDSSESSGSAPDWRKQLKPASPGGPGKPGVVPRPAVKPPPLGHKPSVGVKPKPKLGSRPSDSGIETDSKDHSASGSISSIKSDSSQDGKERGTSPLQLAPLPPLEILGSPPKKPAKPVNVRLPPPTGVKTRKPATPKRTTPVLPSRAPEPPRVPPHPGIPEFNSQSPNDDGPQETYDDVGVPPPLPSTANRPALNKNRVSLIPTMDSGDEMEDEELYDEGTSAPIGSDGDSAPPPPPALTTLPVHVPQTSASSSSSNYPQTSGYSGTSENTGSGGDFGDIYDPVDDDVDDCDQLYEPLDMDGGGQSGSPGQDAAELEAERKKQEKLKKDQERQQKKEEERRKKEEKEEKKKKEKEMKELKKKFKVKGDWSVLEMGTAKADVGDPSDKFQVICTQGDTLEIIRKGSPNPAGKWLVRNTLGDPGYIDEELVQTSFADFGDEYDAVGVDNEEDFEDVYDIAS